MANYDKDMAEERIQIRDDKKKIYEDDKKKKASEGIKMYGSPNHKSYGSPNEMGHSPAEMSYGGAPTKMKMGAPWTSKHAHRLGENPDIKYGGAVIDQTAQKSAMKMNHGSPAKEKMNMVKGPDGKMVPDFAVDGKGANDMKK